MNEASLTITIPEGDEIQVDVTYSHIPAEKPDWLTGYPGCDETADILHVINTATGENLDHLIQDGEISEQIIRGCLENEEGEHSRHMEHLAEVQRGF